MIKSRDDSISARDTQIARLQSELDVIRAVHSNKVCCGGRGGGIVGEWESDWFKHARGPTYPYVCVYTPGGRGEAREIDCDQGRRDRGPPERLAAKEKQQAGLEYTYNSFKVKYDRCLDLIAALRRQIKETKDALELDSPKLLDWEPACPPVEVM